MSVQVYTKLNLNLYLESAMRRRIRAPAGCANRLQNPLEIDLDLRQYAYRYNEKHSLTAVEQ
ncbi:hypothetical protein PUN28_001148 [Cardiocondyla obscurior]|uniref:Uncharacterized protein n=1 Tax=Cardiocondyla obscurior TaxID=286306 RepID=A0AAW2H3R2_9HYME